MNHVLIGAPTYDGTRYNALAIARTLRHPPEDTLVNLIEFSGSVLTYAFNSLWCAALNLRTHEVPLTHFLLWHADVMPEQENWLQILMDEQRRVEADVISAVIPIKNDLGMTSTARDTDPWNPLRFSTAEVALMKEPTWTQPDLLINTGLMLVDFTKPWVEGVCFTMYDRIIKDDKGDFRAQFAPEDWGLARGLRRMGVPFYATKAVTVQHIGKAAYSSANVWGYATDEEYRANRKD